MQTPEQIEHHYRIEKALAERLRRADRAVRGPLYGQVYDELLREVPHHPYLTRRADTDAKRLVAAELLPFLSRFLEPQTVFLEIGAGDCSLSREVAQRVRLCYALDVSSEILARDEPKVRAVLSDGCSVPVPAGSITVAYSNQVMEHIHPDDAIAQLDNIYRALAPGGRYVCVTPSRLNGPHDVSRYFDDVATGLHLKEYTFGELAALFRRAGFRRVAPYVRLGRRYLRAPLPLLVLRERALELLPVRLRRRTGRVRGIRNLLFMHVAALK